MKKKKLKLSNTIDETDIYSEYEHLEEDSDSTDENQVGNKKGKKNFQEEYDDLIIIRNKESELLKKIRQKEEELRKLNSNLKKNRREQNTIINKFCTLHSSEVKNASKERRNRQEDNTGGFNNVKPVPEILIKYLNLEPGTKLSRPPIVHLLNEKFKENNLKDGRDTILDFENAKALGLNNGYKIKFSNFQTFVASFYKKSNNKNSNVIEV